MRITYLLPSDRRDYVPLVYFDYGVMAGIFVSHVLLPFTLTSSMYLLTIEMIRGLGWFLRVRSRIAIYLDGINVTRYQQDSPKYW